MTDLLTPERVEELRRVAEVGARLVEKPKGQSWNRAEAMAFSKWVEVFDPPTVLALLDEVARLHARDEPAWSELLERIADLEAEVERLNRVRVRLTAERVEARATHAEFVEALSALIPDGDEAEYSNPEGAVESILVDCFTAYVKQRDRFAAALDRVRALADRWRDTRAGRVRPIVDAAELEVRRALGEESV